MNCAHVAAFTAIAFGCATPYRKLFFSFPKTARKTRIFEIVKPSVGSPHSHQPQGKLRGKPIDEYRGCLEARGIQVMIDNNLDFDVALYPYELVTYGETGQVFQNWMQYRLVMQYLEQMRDDQTLVLVSGHPLGLFTTRRDAPRLISTNGLMIGMFDTPAEFHRAAALGVANYGQMTAGGLACTCLPPQRRRHSAAPLTQRLLQTLDHRALCTART